MACLKFYYSKKAVVPDNLMMNIGSSFTYHLNNIMEITLYLILTLTLTLLHN